MIARAVARLEFTAPILTACALAGCRPAAGTRADAGADAITRETCGSCHRIPGTEEANGMPA